MSPPHHSDNQDTSQRNRSGSLRKARAAKHARLRPRQLRCEPLEDRRLLSVFTNNTPMPIKDNGTMTSPITISPTDGNFIVADLNVTLNVTHTRAPDLDVLLIAPDGTRVELFTDVGTTKSQNFTNTILDDGATKSITLGTAPFSGTFRPEGNLSLVEGKQAQGTWKLEITDDQKQSTGTLKSWSIDVTSAGVPAGDNFIDTNPTMLGNAGRSAGAASIIPSRKVVVSNNGDAMAVWQESKGPGDTGPWYAMAARYVGGNWLEPEVITGGAHSNIRNGLELVGDGLGNYLVIQVGARPASQLIANRYVDGRGWQPEVTIAGGNAYYARASMAHGEDGVTRAVVAWGFSSLDAKINRLDNFAEGIWLGEEIAESLPADPGVAWNSIDVAMAQNGDFMLVFTNAGDIDFLHPRDAYYRVYRQSLGRWEGPETLLENRSEQASSTRVEMNSRGEAMVVWGQYTGPDNTAELWARRCNGLDWAIPEKIVDSTAETRLSEIAKVALGENGEAIMFWAQPRDGSIFSNVYVRHHDGTQWGEITKLDTEDLGSVGAGPSSTPNASRMNIAMDDAGNAAAVWTQSDGTYINVWASQFDGATWSTAQKLENAALDAVLPSVDMNAGVAQVIWTQSNGLLNHMYSATLSLPGSGSPLLADPSWTASTGTGTQLVQRDAVKEAAAALSMWAQRMNLAEVPRVNVFIADLPAGQLGWASGHTITLDNNANGAGWFVDATPWEHSEFVGLNSAASGRVDLLTVVTHEIGHVLGFEHSLDTQDVMATTLPFGTRRLPGLGQLKTVPSTLGSLPSPISITTSHTALTKREPLVRTLPPSAADKTDLYLLKPLAMQIVEQSTSRPESIAARILSAVLDERADVLDGSVLDLLAHAAT